MIRILTQNDLNLTKFHEKVVITESNNQDVHVHRSLIRNYTARPKIIFDKDSMIGRHMDIR